MSSFPRRWQRKRLRNAADYKPAEPIVCLHKDGGYSVLHPTKGWRRVSALRARYAAEERFSS